MKTAGFWHSAVCLAIAFLASFAGLARAAPFPLERPLQGDWIALAGGSPFTARGNPIDLGRAGESEVVVAEELDSADRATQAQSQNRKAALASSEEAAPMAIKDPSGWDTISLIGKALIGIGTLVTLASAARMLMAKRAQRI